MHIEITWFKREGKYYSEGEAEYDCNLFHEAIDEFKRQLKLGIRPGLINRINNDFHALVKVYTENGPLMFLVTAED